MGWMRTLFLGDIGNRLDIEDNENRIADLRQSQRRRNAEKRERDDSQDARLAGLERDVETLQVAVGTLSRLLVQKGVATEPEIGRLLDALDDAAAD